MGVERTRYNGKYQLSSSRLRVSSQPCLLRDGAHSQTWPGAQYSLPARGGLGDLLLLLPVGRMGQKRKRSSMELLVFKLAPFQG